MRKILIAALFLAAGTMTFVSCSKDDEGDNVDNSKVQCWEVTTEVSFMGQSQQAGVEYIWGSGTEIDEMIKEAEDADPTGMMSMHKKPSDKSEEDCY